MDELTTLRRRVAAAEAQAARARPATDSGTPSVLARTVKVGTYPTTPGGPFMIIALAVEAAAAPGSPATLTPAGDPFLAVNVGSALPPENTPVIATFVGEWCIQFDG